MTAVQYVWRGLARRKMADVLGEPPSILRRSAEVVSFLALAGLLLYGTVWSCYNSFYGTFGLEPEDVGVTYARTISRAAVGFLTLLLILGLVLFLLVNPLKIGEAGRRATSSAARWLAFAVVCIFVLTVYFMSGLLPDSYDQTGYHGRYTFLKATVLLVLGSASLFSAILAVLRPTRWSRTIDLARGRLWRAPNGSRPRLRDMAARTAPAILAVVLVAFIGLPMVVGARLADNVKEGSLVAGYGIIPRLILDIQVIPVEVTWIGTPKPAELPSVSTMVLLGQANGTTVLYESVSRRVYRVPSSNLLLSSKPVGELPPARSPWLQLL
jgi:hypothetical protein